MRLFFALTLCTLVGLASGCARKEFDGPTVKEFTGRLVRDGQPVSFAGEQGVQVQLFHEKAQSFNVPIQADGSWKIGWMPIGKYSATLLRGKANEKGPPRRYGIPGGLTIEDGKTEYQIELGKGYKP